MANDDHENNAALLEEAESEVLHESRANAAQSETKDFSISMEELIYGASSFHAIVKPVSLTMILSSLAVIYINTDQTKAQGEQTLKMYQAFSITEDQSSATSLGLSLVNALIIVSVIGAMTFFIVILYKFRCMKFLMGYMVIASTVLLMFVGGNMFTVAIDKYNLAIDRISYWVTMYNFAVVGTLAIFYQRGIPSVVNQGYLIANATIVAWQLSYFNDWMAWSLLIMLAFYDLFAVLTPCGPLKALVNLMSKSDAPAMPGLLYEAELPENATRPGKKRTNHNADQNYATTAAPTAAESSNADRYGTDVDEGREQLTVSESADVFDADEDCGCKTNSHLDDSTEPNNEGRCGEVAYEASLSGTMAPFTTISSDSACKTRHKTDGFTRKSSLPPANSTQPLYSERKKNAEMDSHEEHAFSTIIPLAIARVYKLPISLARNSTVDTSHPTAYLGQQLSPSELQTVVSVKFPRGGGRIETTKNRKEELRYLVYDRDGILKRTLLVNEMGKVMEQVIREQDDSEEKGSNNIKLGLGDFIFYSVLVSKAAESGFAAFVACFLSILTGLGGTLVLLSVYHHALPALPISIFLGVVFYILTIYSMEPWIHAMWQVPFYV
ncbi:hypothetical protein HJC23_014017 [Cyclotella cryptica]|uniref:Presenilin n=1 Tax=Cyclotella cryptica TaxID=29204 RepID=A0ABD3QSV6_9STRA|eukprot:CCRYP_002400-RA/>CCRYP_002400-RA protein AED:0.22 eAED:0.22 QI:0/-1/0/1/-1/1/1/0/610